MISADLVEATWRDVGGFSPARARKEADKANRAQPALLLFIVAMTEQLSPSAHALALYLHHVVWQIFSRSCKRRIPRLKPATLEQKWEENEEEMARLESAHPRFLERSAMGQVSSEPNVFRYVIEAIIEAPDDPDDPIQLTEDEEGMLFLVFKTAIDALHEAREQVAGAG